MKKDSPLREQKLIITLTYTGFILIAFELVKGLIVKPIKIFYEGVIFGEGMPFKSYEEDVLSRHKNEFEACLLYLHDFMKAIDSDDMLAIQNLRQHRNDLAHNLAHKLNDLDIEQYTSLVERVDKALFKLSNYRMCVEIASDPKFQNKGINWDTVTGYEYTIFREVLEKLKTLKSPFQNKRFRSHLP